MSEILYLQTDKNVKITAEKVCLRDVAKLSCHNPIVSARCGTLVVSQLPHKGYGRYVISAMDLIREIQKREDKVDVTHIGEPDIVLTYEDPGRKKGFLSIVKTLLVCIVTFFGTMFSIMTFNADVDLGKLFGNIYTQLTGQSSNGFTALEISYSLGIGLGAIFFFNHFGKFSLSHDPTPMEVEMRTYEDDVDTTIVEMENRKES